MTEDQEFEDTIRATWQWNSLKHEFPYMTAEDMVRADNLLRELYSIFFAGSDAQNYEVRPPDDALRAIAAYRKEIALCDLKDVGKPPKELIESGALDELVQQVAEALEEDDNETG